ncbi:hypothetical protein PIB30_102536 [Stylosanthes scabra]|uniref:Uncharacterized protein n=1 Tax=Stylosanthes scabra TaxID=79078 RepID=A0ABU6YVG5_9FABA|nr:hypothetical protein [Stylosanthes scabra]
MEKKKSCQNIRNPCVFSAAERDLYGWVNAEVFTQSSVITFEVLPELRHEMRLTEDLHAPPLGNGFLSFHSHQGRRLLDAFEESIQKFKWHYFKVLPFPSSRPFWLDDKGKSFPWVYWNPEARECRITALDPLETLAFQLLQSLPKMAEVERVGPCSILPHPRVPASASGASASTLAALVPPAPSFGVVKTNED